MKHKLLGLMALMVLASCGQVSDVNIIVTSYITYDAVKSISGDLLTFRNITPWGSELHTFEPSPRDVAAINNADLFVYTHPDLDTWVKTLVANPHSFALSAHYTTTTPHQSEHDSLHFWTNPSYYIETLDALLPIITAIDPAKAESFAANHDEYTTALKQHISELELFLENIQRPVIYFAGHNALDAFGLAFNLEIRSLSDSYKPDGDFLSPEVIKFIEDLKANDVHHLFVEEISEPRMAEVLKAELAKSKHEITILELHGYHNITASQAKEGITYVELFTQNVRNIKQALSA